MKKQKKNKVHAIIISIMTFIWVVLPYYMQVSSKEEIIFQFKTLFDYLQTTFTYSNISAKFINDPEFTIWIIIILLHIFYIIYFNLKNRS